MSDTARMTPGDLRHQGLLLLRDCALPVFAAVTLSLLPTFLGAAILHLSPKAVSSLEGLAGTGFSTPAMLISLAVELLGLLLISPVILLGLYKGLLACLRGEGFKLRCILSGFSRWKTAVALEVLTGLRILGYLILGSIGRALLAFIPVLGPIVGGIGYIMLAWWATMRYMLSDCHLADDSDRACSASDCLTYSVSDVLDFTITGLIEVIWPALLPGFLSNLLSQLLPDSLGLTLATCALDALSTAFIAAGCTVVYVHLRGHYAHAPENVPIDEGLARARALAASTQDDSTN